MFCFYGIYFINCWIKLIDISFGILWNLNYLIIYIVNILYYIWIDCLFKLIIEIIIWIGEVGNIG